MGAAIWEYFYLLARVTSDEPDGNGMFYGVVNFGNPISAETVARDLQEAPYTAKDHLRRLEIEGYVRREFVAGAGYSYTITKSKRWLWKRENAARRAEKPSMETFDDRGEIPTVPGRNPDGGENPTVENTNGDRGQKPTRRWFITSEQWELDNDMTDAEFSKAHPDGRSTFWNFRDEAIEYAKTLFDPRSLNWVRVDWIWY
jgi:hypothetical protein